MPFGRIGIGRVDSAFVVFAFGVIDLQSPAVEARAAQSVVQCRDQFAVGASELVIQVSQFLKRQPFDEGGQQFTVARTPDQLVVKAGAVIAGHAGVGQAHTLKQHAFHTLHFAPGLHKERS